MRRVLISLVTLVVFIFVTAGPAAAVPPTHEPVPTPDDFIVSDCGFDLLFHAIAWRLEITTYFDQEGNIVRLHTSGAAKIRLTNVGTGESEDLNISGPGTYTFPPDGSVLLVGTGKWIYWGLSNRPGEVLFTSGRFEVITTPEGEAILTDPAPNETNMCDVLS
jgi:hypothetical protein